MVKRTPDGRLVYLHCSSIFNGLNAQIRRQKKISQLLSKHRSSIEILTREFNLQDIAVVAKQLLDEKIFESLPRAKLRFPELFQQSEAQEAEREASEAEVVRIEAEAAQDIVLTSDDEGEEEVPEVVEAIDVEEAPAGVLAEVVTVTLDIAGHDASPFEQL